MEISMQEKKMVVPTGTTILRTKRLQKNSSNSTVVVADQMWATTLMSPFCYYVWLLQTEARCNKDAKNR